MCMSCGCKQPNEDHGDDRHITMDTIQDAADAANISPQQVLRNIQEAGAGASSMSGRSDDREQQRRAS